MKNLYIDTEFNSFNGRLISMAIVADLNNYFYEVIDIDDGQPIDPWVAQNVMPKLNQEPIKKLFFQAKLVKFLEQWNEINIIADWPDDISYFCKILMTQPGVKVITPKLHFEVNPDLKDYVSDLPHNALEDAKALYKSSWDYENE